MSICCQRLLSKFMRVVRVVTAGHCCTQPLIATNDVFLLPLVQQEDRTAAHAS